MKTPNTYMNFWEHCKMLRLMDNSIVIPQKTKQKQNDCMIQLLLHL